MEHFMKHFGTYQRDEVVVIGYNPARNDIMIAILSRLGADDRDQLKMIASSPEAQNTNYLVPVLERRNHPRANVPWSNYLIGMLRRSSGAVMTASLRDMENMNPEQKGVFKGYVKEASPSKASESVPEITPLSAPKTVSTLADLGISEEEKMAALGTSYQQATGPTPSAGAVPGELTAVLAQLAQGQSAMLAAIQNLAASPALAPKRPYKTRVSKKAVEAAAPLREEKGIAPLST